ncbi:MAG TPA: AAA family ATPase [Candidatus Pristimantibacillus sp.]|nr:AAA family ATPase [Candidatus Pristimantibacillus sp.]
MNQPTLFMMFGYPGAGKTSTANVIEKLTGAEHLSSDEIRLELFPQPTYTQEEHDAVYDELNRRAEALLKEGKSVVYDANLNRYKHRLEKYEMCERTGAKAVLIWVQTPKDLARERAVMRGHHHLVPKDETFESMFDRVTNVIEEPREDEPLYTLSGDPLEESAVSELLGRL